MTGERLDPGSSLDVTVDERGASKRAVAIGVLSLAGMAIATYLTFIHFRGGQYFCEGVGDCDYVNSSSYAVVAGMPVALFGFLAYAGIFAATIAGERARAEWLVSSSPVAVFALALAGLLYSGYLTYVELYILYAI